MIITLYELKRTYNKTIITEDILDNHLKYSDEKDIDRTIYENTTNLFTKYDSIKGALKIFNDDKSTMPLMSQQNYIMTINKYYNNYMDNDTKLDKMKKKIELLSNISKNISHGDIVENYIFSSQNWGLQNLHGHYSCVMPSYYVTQNTDTDKIVSDSNKYEYNKVSKKFIHNYDPLYPKDLNRTSTKMINYKNIKAVDFHFDNMEVKDYIYAIKIIKDLLDNGYIEDAKKIMKEYNLTDKSLKYLLKIDKINSTKKEIPKVIDKIIKDIFIE
jgi:hypothetical protein